MSVNLKDRKQYAVLLPRKLNRSVFMRRIIIVASHFNMHFNQNYKIRRLSLY